MKVAVIITGFLRTYLESLQYFKASILDKYDTDIYIATWDKQENGQYIDNRFHEIYNDYALRSILVEKTEIYEKNKFVIKKIIRNNDVFTTNPRANEHGEYWANRLKDQWYLVKKCFLSVPDPKQYDIILRIRFDLFLHKISLSRQKGIVVPQDVGGWRFTDHMAYGDPSSMEKYCLLHDKIYDLYEKHNFDITHAVEMPKFYLESYEKPVDIIIDTEIKYFLRK